MKPEFLTSNTGLSHTVISPVVAVILVIAGLLIWFWPRNKAFVPFLAVAILIPTDQAVVLGQFHFPVIRLLALFGLVRILWAKFSGGEKIFSGGVNGIDKAVIVLTLFTAINQILLFMDSAMVVNQLGNMYSVFGTYFLLRFLIRDEEDVKRALRALACVAALVAANMIFEQATGRNLLYSSLGGARASITVIERDDHYRAMGPFGHPILAGTFGGMMLPLFVGLWWKEKMERKYAALGIVAGIVIPLAAASSTALFGLVAGLLALCMWPLRRQMRKIRWGIVLTLVSLHLYMKSPVWHLVSDVDLTGSSSSYHRYQLINQCILHFWNWALMGTKDYWSWGWDMWDLSNQYVANAETGGLIPLIAFLAIIVLGFKYIGRARWAAEGDRQKELFMWAFGASLFANVVAFFGISYFDQTIVPWYAILAMIPAVTAAGASQHATQEDIEMVKSPLNFRPKLVPDPARSGLSSKTLRSPVGSSGPLH